MTLHIHRAAHSDALAHGLADLLAQRGDDPFSWETVVVPQRGVERWLTQRLSHRLGTGARGGDGVCAGVRFLNPRSLVALLTGTERDDPWQPDRLVWAVLDVLDSSLHEPWAAVVARHLGAGMPEEEAELRRSRRYSVARRLARLLTAYADQRPGLLVDWQEGRASDGAGGALPPDLAWQAELWRRVVARVVEATGTPPPAERHAATVAALRSGGLALPDEVTARVSLFGHTRLTRTETELLDALATQREVHLWLPEPSADLADRLGPVVADGPVRRAQDRSAEQVRHPLLASLGRDTRELERTLAGVRGSRARHERADADPPSTLLGWLQADLRADRVPDEALRAGRRVAPDDRSVQVHAAHGRGRQVDVLREVLVGLMADDPTLQPRDVIVMCPDVDAYAPLIQASFGLGADAGGPAVGAHPAHRLRVRLADRGLAVTNPLLGVARQVIALAGGRAGASEVLDLVSAEPVRRRFGLSDADVERITGWVRSAGVRWGLDVEDHDRFGVGFVDGFTWRRGLDRVLLGVTMAEQVDRCVGDVLPLDAVPSGEIDLAGRLAELVDRLEDTARRLRASGPAVEWMAALRDGVSAITSVPMRDAWMQTQFERELVQIADQGSGADTVQVSLPDVRALLEHRFRGRPTRSNFRTGNLTVCTMTPMRSVPHRVVCLLGLDDGAFPRVTTVDGDDVLKRAPVTGEHDPRSEDRQILLDALLATDQTLVITYSGASEHTDSARPPAVPVGELIDALDRTASAPVRDRVLVRHPLQPFSERNFTPEGLGLGQPFSFDSTALQGARARTERRPAAPLLARALPPPEGADEATVEELRAFWRNPAREFLRARDVAVRFEEDEVGDAVPITLDGLEKWAIGDRLLAARGSGVDQESVLAAERLRGALPPGILGEQLLADIGGTAGQLWDKSARDRPGAPTTIDVSLRIAGVDVTGVVRGVQAGEPDPVAVSLTYSSIRAGVLASAWLDVLLLAAATHRPARGVVHARFGRSTRRVSLGPVDVDLAHTQLGQLVRARTDGLLTPFPVPVATGLAWAQYSDEPHRRRWKAQDRWRTEMGALMPGEQDDASFARLFGAQAPIQTLIDAGLPEGAETLWSLLLPLTQGMPR